jgi:hypothetical protein
MDYLRVLLVPFQLTTVILVVVFSLLLSVFDIAGIYGIFASLFLQIWVLKYCYVLIEQLAEGAGEPPVMSTDMLSPFEARPWVQLFIIIAGATACYKIGGYAGLGLGIVLLALLPASIAVLGFGERFYQAVNPVTLFRVIRGLGPLYLAILAAMLVYAGIAALLTRIELPGIFEHAIRLLCELSFFGLIGGCMFLRRGQLGYEPTESPERTAQKEENERIKLRAKMLDEVFQLARVGRQVDATAPLAKWIRDLDAEHACRDAYYVADQMQRWDNPTAVNTIGSTLIRHLLRFGRPEAALAVFERLRTKNAKFTMDSAPDLRTLADFAESSGREELAASMRLETPVFHP